MIWQALCIYVYMSSRYAYSLHAHMYELCMFSYGNISILWCRSVLWWAHSVTPACLCRQMCLQRSGPFFYKPLFMSSARPPLANNWCLDCSLSIWWVSRDQLSPAVLWKVRWKQKLLELGDGKQQWRCKKRELISMRIIQISEIAIRQGLHLYVKRICQNIKYAF